MYNSNSFHGKQKHSQKAENFQQWGESELIRAWMLVILPFVEYFPDLPVHELHH